MDTQSQHQLDDGLHAAGFVFVTGALGTMEARLEIVRTTAAARDREPGRGLVREDQREVEQRRQGQETARRALDDHERHQGRDCDDPDPERGGGRVASARQQVAQEDSHPQRGGHRRGEDADAKGAAEPRSSIPLPTSPDLRVAVALLPRAHVSSSPSVGTHALPSE